MNVLDDIDIKILSSLYESSDITNRDLAKKLEIATTTCQERVKRLKVKGIISGARCDINLRDVAAHIEAMAAIKMIKHSEELADQLRDHLVSLPEVIQAFHMGGQNDFLVHLAVHDTAHLRQFIFKEFTSRDEIQNVETYLVFEHTKSEILPNFKGME